MEEYSFVVSTIIIYFQSAVQVKYCRKYMPFSDLFDLDTYSDVEICPHAKYVPVFPKCEEF